MPKIHLQTYIHVCQLADVQARLNYVSIAAMVDLREHLERARRARWDKASEEEKKAAASNAGRAFWAKLSPEQRSAEMKKRAKKRKKKT